MTYELAEKLKDAGFGNIRHPMEAHRGFFNGKDGLPEVTIPTLSELVEACGNRFLATDKTNEGWKAAGVDFEKKEVVVFTASTLEEAVANLWLKLNNKL